MRIISWNVNGIRATTQKIKNGEKKGSPTNNVIKTLIEEQTPDILCFQEVKTQTQGDLAYLKQHFKHIYTNFAKNKKGYSGTALLTNAEPEWVSYDFTRYSEEEIGIPYNSKEFILEGRVITAKFENYVVVTVYVPNAKPELARIEERIEWEATLRKYLKCLEEETSKPVILCGDLNVAPTEKDIHNPKGKNKTPGYSPQERDEFKKMIENGFTDTFRHLHPDEIKYTYWSNFANARDKNAGWRIDMVLISDSAIGNIIAADCLTDYKGSDHCPVLMDLNI